MYSSEIFPQKYREVGMSLAVAINLSFAGALAMAVPLYQKTLTGSTSDSQPRDPNSSPKQNNEHLILLGSFAALDFVAVILVWVFMRYPKKFAELEEMNVSMIRVASRLQNKLTNTLILSLSSVHRR